MPIPPCNLPTSFHFTRDTITPHRTLEIANALVWLN